MQILSVSITTHPHHITYSHAFRISMLIYIPPFLNIKKSKELPSLCDSQHPLQMKMERKFSDFSSHTATMTNIHKFNVMLLL
jgi:hypothetical protein